jgi:hypothetical protein
MSSKERASALISPELSDMTVAGRSVQIKSFTHSHKAHEKDFWKYKKRERMRVSTSDYIERGPMMPQRHLVECSHNHNCQATYIATVEGLTAEYAVTLNLAS